MYNQVDEDNFNDTCKGYLKRAIRIMHEGDENYKNNLTEEQERRLFTALGWAFDEMTMEDAREEYKKY